MPISQVLEGACRSQEGGVGQNLTCKRRRATLQAHNGAGACPGCTDVHADTRAGTAPRAPGCRHTLVYTQLSQVIGIWESCGAHTLISL